MDTAVWTYQLYLFGAFAPTYRSRFNRAHKKGRAEESPAFVESVGTTWSGYLGASCGCTSSPEGSRSGEGLICADLGAPASWISAGPTSAACPHALKNDHSHIVLRPRKRIILTTRISSANLRWGPMKKAEPIGPAVGRVILCNELSATTRVRSRRGFQARHPRPTGPRSTGTGPSCP